MKNLENISSLVEFLTSLSICEKKMAQFSPKNDLKEKYVW